MKLEKFKKYGKRNKKIIGSVIGIILIICGVLLFKSFAFFESKYDFDVIKGRIPPFNVSDVILAFTIDGVKSNEVFPTENSGHFGTNVICQNGATAEWNNVTWALEHINSNGQKKINCNIEFITTLYGKVKLGDYVSYTPSKTSYTIPKSLTGYSSDQTINPSELDLWRVIKKNEDGTIEMISEYVSSTDVSFYGQTGYVNYIGTLNTIAKQYETEGITSDSRYLGFDGQTEYITNRSNINSNSSGWSDCTSSTNSLKGSEREKLGGGDWLWEKDVNLIKATSGDLKAYKKGTTIYSNYWLASRYHYRDTGGDKISQASVACFINNGGFVICDPALSFWYWHYVAKVSYSYENSASYRPIILIKSGVMVSEGVGSESSPYKIN